MREGGNLVTLHAMEGKTLQQWVHRRSLTFDDSRLQPITLRHIVFLLHVCSVSVLSGVIWETSCYIKMEEEEKEEEPSGICRAKPLPLADDVSRTSTLLCTALSTFTVRDFHCIISRSRLILPQS